MKIKAILFPALITSAQVISLFSGGNFAYAGGNNIDEARALLDAMRVREAYVDAANSVPFINEAGVEATKKYHDRTYNGMARIYAEVYSAKELQALTAFYASPVGQAFTKKRPKGLALLYVDTSRKIDPINLSESAALYRVMSGGSPKDKAGNLYVSASGNSKDRVVLGSGFNEHTVRAFALIYTVEELRGIRAFFESSDGQSFLQKKPLLMEKYYKFLNEFQAEVRNEIKKGK